MTRRLKSGSGPGDSEMVPAAMVAVLIRGVEAARSSIATLKAGPDAFCSRFGFSEEEADAIWIVLTKAGCAGLGLRGRVRVNAACLAALVPVLRRVHAEAVEHERRLH